MMFFTKNTKSVIVVVCFLVVSVGAFAAGKKSDSDAWTWTWLGVVENPSHMFPDTHVDKFRDATSGVVCYVYSANSVTAVTFTNNGVSKDGVKGSELGTMSCVSERR